MFAAAMPRLYVDRRGEKRMRDDALIACHAAVTRYYAAVTPCRLFIIRYDAAYVYLPRVAFTPRQRRAISDMLPARKSPPPTAAAPPFSSRDA